MGRLVLPHALLPAVKGLRLKPGAVQPMLSPGYTALQEAEAEPAEETRGEEQSDFCLIDTFRRAAFNPKVNVLSCFVFWCFFSQTSEQEMVCFMHNNVRV